MLPRDMAKIGLLVLNDGRWNDNQIVSKEWLLQSTKPHVAESEYFDYGYQWWLRSKDSKQWWVEPHSSSGKEHDMIIALGWGGQHIMVFPDLNVVVVTTGGTYTSSTKIFALLEKYIIPAFN
jgi:CubicO group peptidase (beta-lactamase class C family)